MSIYSGEASTFEDLLNANSYTKKHSGADFSFLNTADDVLAPTSDEFDTELDALIESIDIGQLTVPPTTNPFEFRQFDSYGCGPASAFTFSSSESSYDSRSTHSESSYGHSPKDTSSNYSFPADLDNDFQSFAVTSPSQGLDLSSLDCVDPAAFNMRSPPPSYSQRSSFSDYGPARGNAHFLNQLVNYGDTASVDHLPSSFTSPIPLIPFSEGAHYDNKGKPKKFKCTMCPRAFDRAFNLKTHMDTHNPNRVKAFVCDHGSCRRAFSRKHDLGRHITSVHRSDSETKPKSIGVGKGAMRCDNCGKGTARIAVTCDCAEGDHHHQVK